MQAPSLMALVARKQKNMRLLHTMAAQMGCPVIGEYLTGGEALRSIPSREVDIVVIDDDLEDMTSFALARALSQVCTASILLMQQADRQDTIMEDLISLDVVVLKKPLHRIAFSQTVETMMHYRQRIHRLHQQLDQLRSDISRRALADKAKTMLMNRMKMSESEAWRFLQKTSMDTGKPLDEIARLVLEKLRKN